MIEVQTEKTIVVTMRLTARQAEYIQALVQNVENYEDEPADLQAVREELFMALKGALA